MIRIYIATAMLIGATHVASADEPTPAPAPAPAPTATPAPTKQELATAKKLFEQGNALYKAGKLPEAVAKLEESYKLSKNAFLLYNIGHIYDQLGKQDLVLKYYKQFLADAAADAPMRPDVTKRVEALEQEAAAPAAPEPVVEEKPQTAVKLEHQLIEAAPPGVPCDVTASITDPALTVTLFYRGSGDVKFTSKPMTKRKEELVAHIPGAAMTGSWIQYYIEARDAQNNLVTRNGKSTSPNLMLIDSKAPTHFFPDLVEPGESTVVIPQPGDIVHSGSGSGGVDTVDTGPPFLRAKWIATGSAAVMFGVSLSSYLIAKRQHDDLVKDANSCGTPPCRSWDAGYNGDIESRGFRYDTIYKITLGVGIAATGVAGYFWYRALTAKKADAQATLITPTVGNQFAGVSAVGRF